MSELLADQTLKAEINLYFDLLVPEGAENAPLVLAIHGYGAHKRQMMREAKLVVPENFVIASLQAPHQHFARRDDGYRVGFGWLTDHKPEEYIALHHKFILDVIEALDGVIDRSRIYLYGFSQACALNFRFAFTYPDVLKGLVGVCGGLPGDIETNPIYKPFSAETLYIYGNDDEFYAQEKFAEFDAKLASRLTNYRSIQYDAKHEITEAMRADIRAFFLRFA